MRTIFIFLIVILIFSFSYVAIRRVGYSGSPLSGVYYPNFLSAYNAAIARDIIQIYGNVTVSNPGVAIRKKVTIKDFRYNFDVNPNLLATSVDAPSKFLGNQILTFEPGSENFIIEGNAFSS